MASESSYKAISRDVSLKEYSTDKGYRHAAHAALYYPTEEIFFNKYPFRFVIMMQMRFDGTLGFPGGLVDEGESPEEAVSRELVEELGCQIQDFNIAVAHHLFTQVSEQTKLCLHFYAQPLDQATFQQVEMHALKGSDYGHEVLGTVRVPLYTLSNGLGLPAFLRNQFIGTARLQLLRVIEELLGPDYVKTAMEASHILDCVVTAKTIDI